MKISLLDNQIELILDSLKSYSKKSDKKQLIYSTYNSILAQQISHNAVITSDTQCNKNVTQM